MNTYAFDETGKCICVVHGVFDYDAPVVVQADGKTDPNLVWYDYATGQIAPRTAFPLEVTTNTVSGIPAGTTAFIGPDQFIIDDGVFTIEVDLPQTVLVHLEHVRHLMTDVEVPCEV